MSFLLRSHGSSPYETTLVGEYFRLLLLLVSLPLLAWYARIASGLVPLVLLTANCLLILSLVTTRGHRLLRALLAWGLTAGVYLAIFANPINLTQESDFTVAPSGVLLGCLVVATLFETFPLFAGQLEEGNMAEIRETD